MTNFEKVAATPEALGAFLASLPVASGPWDEEFQRRCCSGCEREDCDGGSRCPHEEKRNSPLWWLGLECTGGMGQFTGFSMRPEDYRRILGSALEKVKREREQRCLRDGDYRYTEEEAVLLELLPILMMDDAQSVTVSKEERIRFYQTKAKTGDDETEEDVIRAMHQNFVRAKTDAAKQRTRYFPCKKCGTQWHRPDAVYCCQCGAKLGDTKNQAV